jgi:hypothetical protein
LPPARTTPARAETRDERSGQSVADHPHECQQVVEVPLHDLQDDRGVDLQIAVHDDVAERDHAPAEVAHRRRDPLGVREVIEGGAVVRRFAEVLLGSDRERDVEHRLAGDQQRMLDEPLLHLVGQETVRLSELPDLGHAIGDEGQPLGDPVSRVHARRSTSRR